ncbi:MAG: RNA-guided endonuclease InsQ/TnpB family protein [Ktedonobacteraceae bacterium]
MRKMFLYRIYPTKKQETKLNETLEECRWLYKHLLEKRKEAYEQEGKCLSCYGQQATYPMLKRERPSLNTVHSQVLQNVAVRIDLAFKAFFRRCKAETLAGGQVKKPGFPRFRGVNRYDSFSYPQFGFKIDEQGKLALSGIGHVKIILHRPIRGQIKTLTIRRSSTGKWYVSFSVECGAERLPDRSEQVGIDVGLKTFAALSNGEEIDNPRFFRKEEKDLAKVQRTYSKLAKGTPERRKQRKAVARVHERIAFKRDNFSHQQSRQIVDRFGVICVEDLHVNHMTHNHCLAKSIHDAAWSEFFSKLSCKAEEAGRRYVAVDPAYTSQDCSRCHSRQYMPLTERIYHCPCCLLELDRDVNAAKNILALGLQRIGIQPVEAPAF